MQLAAAMALYADLHEERPYHSGNFDEWSDKRSRDFAFHYSDGVSFYLAETDVNPDDDFLGDGSVVEKSPGDEGEPE